MCLSPITLRSDTGIRHVPCGCCRECVQQRRGDWSLRSLFEYEDNVINKKWKPYFLTLTYDDDCIPTVVDTDSGLEYRVLNYDHWHQTTNYLRIAKKHKSDEYRYLLCGEYGHLHLRPHYHVLLYAKSVDLVHEICDYWYDHFCPKALQLVKDGRYVKYKIGVYCVPVDVTKTDSAIKVSRYITKYIVKGEFDVTKTTMKEFYRKYSARVYCSRGYGMQKLDYFNSLLKQFTGRKRIYNQNLKHYEYSTLYLDYIQRSLRVLVGPDMRDPTKPYYQRLPKAYFDRLLPKKMYTLASIGWTPDGQELQFTKRRVKETASYYRYLSEQTALSYYNEENMLRQLMVDAKLVYGEGYQNYDKYLCEKDRADRLRNDLLSAKYRSINTRAYHTEKDLQ